MQAAMSRTVLFFGDSNTRGYGAGRERSFAKVIAGALPAPLAAAWRVASAGADSDFRAIPPRLDAALAKHRPAILVCQCPTGPLAYFVQYPPWLARIRGVYNAFFQWRRERGITADLRRRPPDQRTRREALYDGRYVDTLYRWRPASWPITRHANRILAARYGLVVKATRERYLELMARQRDRIRAQTSAVVLFLGPFPHDESFYPGFGARVRAWSEDLAALLHRPAEGSTYLDVYRPLTVESPGRYLLRDGAHLTAEGHRRVAHLILPTLVALMHEVGAASAPGRGPASPDITDAPEG
jgi:lysophospholipase L1-like esterase